MLEYPPLINTELTPVQIIGQFNMQALIGHIKHFEENKDKVGRPVNKSMGELITRLAEYGYYINDIDKHGEVRFLVVTKNEVQREFEGPVLERLRQMSEKELQEMGRGGYRDIIKAQQAHKNI